MLIAAAAVKGNELSGLNLLGLFVSITGIGAYNYIKYQENMAPQKGGYQRVENMEMAFLTWA